MGLAPVLIRNGPSGLSDYIVTMSGASGLAEVPTKFSNAASSTTNNLNLQSIVNFQASDKVLLVGDASEPCYISQVNSTFTAVETSTALPLGGEHYKARISGQDIISASSYVLNLGKDPQFSVMSVSDDHRLYIYNLLEIAAPNANQANPSLFLENIYHMRAIYGIDPNNDGDNSDLTWVRPTGQYSFNKVRYDAQKISQIKAIKVAIVMRTDIQEKEAISANTVRVFADTNTPRNIPLDDSNYRYRTFEATIPIRNNLL